MHKRNPSRLALVIAWIWLLAQPSAAQSYAWVLLKDKPCDLSVAPEDLSQEAIARRAAQGLALWDATDYPVHSAYIEVLRAGSDSVCFASRWFNMVAVRATEAQLQQIAALPFVQAVERPVPTEAVLAAEPRTQAMAGKYVPESYRQYQMIRLGQETFARHGLNGKGVLVAVFDAGFTGVDKDPVFAHLRPRIRDTWDFVGNDPNVYHGATHGTTVLACVGGMTSQGPVGLAHEADFLLARTEMSQREPFREEVFWMQAMEWADRKGAQVINSSLGYNKPRYTPGDMDGHKSYVAKAANKAASKGMLVVNAAGNEGNDSWKYLITPADADSVLAVGGTNPHTDIRINFSSYGPTADGRLKPEVCAPGMAAGTNGNSKGLGIHYGTSFASPLVAGFAACARQHLPSLPVMELKARILQAGHLYPYFDYSHGYGVPTAQRLLDAGKVFDTVNVTFHVASVAIETDEEEETEVLVVKLNSHLPLKSVTRTLFYHVADAGGRLKTYAVARVLPRDANASSEMEIRITVEDPEGTELVGTEDIIRIHYEGYTHEIHRP
ncbi:MAG: S8 family serine peptidase [Bacteroidetes bacterium]|nr:S8 family serine peptidase [Bacteroidota bacterium]